jgi:hypothetical protein
MRALKVTSKMPLRDVEASGRMHVGAQESETSQRCFLTSTDGGELSEAIFLVCPKRINTPRTLAHAAPK